MEQKKLSRARLALCLCAVSKADAAVVYFPASARVSSTTIIGVVHGTAVARYTRSPRHEIILEE